MSSECVYLMPNNLYICDYITVTGNQSNPPPPREYNYVSVLKAITTELNLQPHLKP
jgi:hypothetical protein